jgi:thymidylate synthase (FAD)
MLDKESILGKEFTCLDKGFVRLLDVMGDDAAIVQAARVSYGKGTKSVSEDRGLIRYLMRNRHTSPFEMVEFKFHVKLPIFVARQWIRHRTANVNEYSGRYSEMKDEFYLPEPEQVRTQSSLNKQGRSDELLPRQQADEVLHRLGQSQQDSFNEYKELLDMNLARELARINLPLSSYTEWYWKIDLHNLLHFLKLRLDFHAQYEIRIYAETMAELIKPFVPLTWEAFEDYMLYAVNLSRQEFDLLRKFVDPNILNEESLKQNGLSAREARELIEKFTK